MEHARITAQEDPPDEAPWAVQLVARIEKAEPPTRTAVCEAAAMAVVSLLDHPTAVDGAWTPAIDRWMAGRIRKHCRRARGAAWERVQVLDGVTFDHGGAQVRAFVPGPVDAIPAEIARLQLSGSELEDPARRREEDPSPGGPVVISICPEPFLVLGKAAAAAGHAAQLARMTMDVERLAVWKASGFAVVVEQPDPSRWLSLRDIAQIEVIDAGFTEVEPGTCTALARFA